jgi:hypothetical protein
MTAVGGGIVEADPPQHSIKHREKCGLIPKALAMYDRFLSDGSFAPVLAVGIGMTSMIKSDYLGVACCNTVPLPKGNLTQ